MDEFDAYDLTLEGVAGVGVGVGKTVVIRPKPYEMSSCLCQTLLRYLVRKLAQLHINTL